jgi:tetratricopeptide (TPR) repeat protein
MRFTVPFGLNVFLVLAIALPAVLAQDTGQRVISGWVRDSRGAPVDGADVLLKSSSNEPAVATTTDREGKFSLACDKPGDYALRVKKAGFRDAVKDLTPSSARVEIVLSPVPPAGARATSIGAMQFDDKTDFAVAGITDWTAAGGHGSDANLRASEAMARDTRTLGVRQTGNSLVPGESETVLRSALAREPRNFEANDALGRLYLQEHRFAEAIPLLKSAFELNKTNTQTGRDLIAAYEGAGQYDQARSQLQQLLAGDDRAEWHRRLGDVEEASHQPLAAERQYERAVEEDASEENYFAWGGELLVHRAVEPAIEVFTKGVHAFAHSERMLAGLGAALYANGQYAAAAQRVCEASDLNPGDSTPYSFLGEMEQFSTEPLPCAPDRLRRFASDHPENPWASFYYAQALVKSGADRASEIENLLSRSVAADRKFAPGYLELGILYSERGDSSQAAEFYEKAEAAAPNLAEPHFRLAQIYKRAGKTDRAAQEFETFERIKRSEAAQVEQRRREIQQFVVVLKNSPPPRTK